MPQQKHPAKRINDTMHIKWNVHISFLAFSAADTALYTALYGTHVTAACMQIAHVQCAFLWLQYNTCNSDMLGST